MFTHSTKFKFEITLNLSMQHINYPSQIHYNVKHILDFMVWTLTLTMIPNPSPYHLSYIYRKCDKIECKGSRVQDQTKYMTICSFHSSFTHSFQILTVTRNIGQGSRFYHHLTAKIPKIWTSHFHNKRYVF